MIPKVHEIPALTKYSLCASVPCFFDRSGQDFIHELLCIVLVSYRRSDCFEGITQHVMSVSVAAAGHYETLAAVVNNFCLACFDKGFCAFPIAYIDVFAVFHGERLCNLVAFRSEYLSVDHKISLFCRTANSKTENHKCCQQKTKHFLRDTHIFIFSYKTYLQQIEREKVRFSDSIPSFTPLYQVA